MVVNADVDEIPISATALVRATRIAGDAVADTLEPPKRSMWSISPGVSRS